MLTTAGAVVLALVCLPALLLVAVLALATLALWGLYDDIGIGCCIAIGGALALGALIDKSKRRETKVSQTLDARLAQEAAMRMFAETRGVKPTPDNLQRLVPEYVAFVREVLAELSKGKSYVSLPGPIEGKLFEQECRKQEAVNELLGH